MIETEFIFKSNICSRNCPVHQQMAFYHHALSTGSALLCAQLIVSTIIHTVYTPGLLKDCAMMNAW